MFLARMGASTPEIIILRLGNKYGNSEINGMTAFDGWLGIFERQIL